VKLVVILSETKNLLLQKRETLRPTQGNRWKGMLILTFIQPNFTWLNSYLFYSEIFTTSPNRCPIISFLEDS